MLPETINYCLQCKDTQGRLGSFAYSYKTDEGFVAISPIFSDLLDFYAWAHNQGYYSKPGSCDFIMYRSR